MKTKFPIHQARRQEGVAVIIMLVLLSLIVLYLATNVRSLNSLQTELKLTDQRQLHRLSTARSPSTGEIANAVSSVTNNPSPANP